MTIAPFFLVPGSEPEDDASQSAVGELTTGQDHSSPEPRTPWPPSGLCGTLPPATVMSRAGRAAPESAGRRPVIVLRPFAVRC